jgi:plasmid maintenance system killer protein
MILDLLDQATMPADVELPSLRLEHLGLDGAGRTRFGIVRANQWQILFSWSDGDAYEVEIVDFATRI